MDDWAAVDRKYMALLADYQNGLRDVEFPTDGKNWTDL